MNNAHQDLDFDTEDPGIRMAAVCYPLGLSGLSDAQKGKLADCTNYTLWAYIVGMQSVSAIT